LSISTILRSWSKAVLVPRLQIVRMLGSAGVGLTLTVVGVDIALGLLPVAFIFATSILVGRVPAAVAAGANSGAFGELISAFSFAAVCFLGQQVLVPIRSALGERMKRRVDGRLRDQTLGIVMDSIDIGPLEDGKTLDALSEATRLFDTSTTPGAACSGLLALIARYTRLLGLVAVVGAVVSWFAAGALGCATMLFRYGQRGGLRKYSAAWRQVAHHNRRALYLRELAAGPGAAKEMRVFGLTKWLSQRYRSAFFAGYEHVSRKRRQIYLRPYLAYTSIGLVVAAAVLVTMAVDAAEGRISLTAFALSVQAAIAALLLGEFYPESDVPTQFGMQAVGALEEVRGRIASSRAEKSSKRIELAAAVPVQCVRFENVHFRYPGSQRPVLQGLSLELPAGKTTAIVGDNGAGKTTLVKLLTRLYQPTAGRICVDGIDIADIDAVAWRRQLSVIFQDFVRYELSAADNVALGSAHAARDLRVVERAAERAGILDAFAGLPLKLDTPLTRAHAGGIDLSGGQWQRVAIARSLYALSTGARLLILDEPTSALDVRAEVAFFDRFVELTRGVTSLLISHRFSSVRRADRIIVIGAGGVVEQGTHAQLMAAAGRYAQLFKLQAERFAGGGEARSESLEEAEKV
jgi:ATP-binding cassette, subfamily B, bacterial